MSPNRFLIFFKWFLTACVHVCVAAAGHGQSTPTQEGGLACDGIANASECHRQAIVDAKGLAGSGGCCGFGMGG